MIDPTEKSYDQASIEMIKKATIGEVNTIEAGIEVLTGHQD